jgi:hypothetical protein
MDNQNKSVNERWARGDEPGERGYATDPGFASTTEYSETEYAVDRRAADTPLGDEADAQRTAEIRKDIDRTRADMGETLDAIQDRLRPGNIVSRAAQSAKETATEKVRQIGQTFQGGGLSGMRSDIRGNNALVERVRENPIPAAIAAASLAWLVFGGRTHRGPHQGNAFYRAAGDREPYAGETRSGLNTRIDQSAEGGWTGQMQQVVGQTTSQLSDTAQDVRHRGRRLANENPVAAGMLAAVAGLAIGLMLPETERENELMGDARDSLIDRGRQTVTDAAQQVQRVASDVTEAAKRIAGDDGGTSDVRGADNP